MSTTKKGNAAGGGNLPKVNTKGGQTVAATAAAGGNGGKTIAPSKATGDGKLPKITQQKIISTSATTKTPTKGSVLVPIEKATKSPTAVTTSTEADSDAPNDGQATAEKPSNSEGASVSEGLVTSGESVEGVAVAAAAAAVTAAPIEASLVVVPEEPIPEPEPEPPKNLNGNATLIYEQYNEQFPILNGSTTHENIDEVYCLSFVMPNCLIHLSHLTPAEKREREAAGALDYFIEEIPRGTYQGLEADKTYYVYVEQEAEQLARDQQIMRRKATLMVGGGGKKSDDDGIVRDDGRGGMESCSCVYGNPCVDEYGCKDWDNRFAIATKNGWKGF